MKGRAKSDDSRHLSKKGARYFSEHRPLGLGDKGRALPSDSAPSVAHSRDMQVHYQQSPVTAPIPQQVLGVDLVPIVHDEIPGAPRTSLTAVAEDTMIVAAGALTDEADLVRKDALVSEHIT